MRIEKISAVTLKVASMRDSVRFYKDVLSMEIVFGGKMPLSLRFALKRRSTRSSI